MDLRSNEITEAAAAKIRSMKIGLTGSMYPVPPDVPEASRAEWQLRRVAELGCTAHQIAHLPESPEELARLGRLAATLGVELEGHVRGVFDLLGPSAAENRAQVERSIGQAKLLGMDTLRTGYGRLTVETSRYNRNWGLKVHMARLTANLKEAAVMARDTGIRIAVENHCDFTGRELAEMLARVDSPHIGAALDTANGYTVYCDPNDDVEALAPYAFTTHIKDMRMANSRIRGTIPILPEGCALGEGHVDIPHALELLARHSPYANGLHLIVEIGWVNFDQDRDLQEQQFALFHRCIEYLQQLQHRQGERA